MKEPSRPRTQSLLTGQPACQQRFPSPAGLRGAGYPGQRAFRCAAISRYFRRRGPDLAARVSPGWRSGGRARLIVAGIWMAAKHQPRPEHGSNGQASHDRDASLLRPRVRQAENRAGKDGVGRDDHDASHPPYTAVTVSKRKYHRGKADVPHGSQDRLARWPAQPDQCRGDEQANHHIQGVAVQGRAQGRRAPPASCQVDRGDGVRQARHRREHQTTYHDLRYREAVPERRRSSLHRHAGGDHDDQRPGGDGHIWPSCRRWPDRRFQFCLLFGYCSPQPGDPPPGKPQTCKTPAGHTEGNRVQRYDKEPEQAARGGRQKARHHRQAHTCHAHRDGPAEHHNLAVQPDAPRYHRAQAKQSCQVEDIRSDDDPGPKPLLMTGHRTYGGRDLRRVCRHRCDNAQQGLRQAQALADPLKPGNQQPAGCQAHKRPGEKRRYCGHGSHSPESPHRRCARRQSASTMAAPPLATARRTVRCGKRCFAVWPVRQRALRAASSALNALPVPCPWRVKHQRVRWPSSRSGRTSLECFITNVVPTRLPGSPNTEHNPAEPTANRAAVA